MTKHALRSALSLAAMIGLVACADMTNHEAGNAVETSSASSAVVIDRPTSPNRITVHGPTHLTVHTEVEIDAPVEVVWETVMAEDKSWSPSYYKFEGEFREGGIMQVTLRDPLNRGADADLSYSFEWSYEEGRRFGWTGPSVTGGPVSDNHQFVMVPLSPTKTLFVQSDDVTGTDPSVIDLSSEQTLGFIQALATENYMAFNAALKKQAEANYKAQK